MKSIELLLLATSLLSGADQKKEAQQDSPEQSAFSEAAALHVLADATAKNREKDKLGWLAGLDEILVKYPKTRAAIYAKLIRENPALAAVEDLSPSESLRAVALLREALVIAEQPLLAVGCRKTQTLVTSIPRQGLFPELRYFIEGLEFFFSEYGEVQMQYERKTDPEFVRARNEENDKNFNFLSRDVLASQKTSSSSYAASKDNSKDIGGGVSTSGVNFNYKSGEKTDSSGRTESDEQSRVEREFLSLVLFQRYKPDEALERKLEKGRTVLGNFVSLWARLAPIAERLMAPQRDDDAQLQTLVEERRWKDAHEISLSLLKKDPHSLSYRIAAAKSALQLGNLDEASKQVSLARERTPGHSQCDGIEGVILARRARYARASQLLEAAYNKGNRSPELEYYLALCLMEQGSRKKADAFAEAAVILGMKSGSEPESHKSVGDLLKANEVILEKCKRCLEEYTTCSNELGNLKTSPQSPEYQKSPVYQKWLRSSVSFDDLFEHELFESGKFRIAEAYWMSIVATAGQRDARNGWVQISRAMAAQGRMEEAVDVLGTAVQLGFHDTKVVEKDEFLRLLTTNARWKDVAKAMQKVGEKKQAEQKEGEQRARDAMKDMLVGGWKFSTGNTIVYEANGTYHGSLKGNWKIEGRGILRTECNGDPGCDCRYGIRELEKDRLELWDIRLKKVMSATRMKP